MFGYSRGRPNSWPLDVTMSGSTAGLIKSIHPDEYVLGATGLAGALTVEAGHSSQWSLGGYLH